MKQIFLVEDDKAIAKNLILLLRAEGYGVVHGATQKETIALLATAQFDLALVDLSLPDGNGFAVYTEVKEMQKIPVIFLTASGDEASVVTGLNLGAEDYIIKPFPFWKGSEHTPLGVFIASPKHKTLNPQIPGDFGGKIRLALVQKPHKARRFPNGAQVGRVFNSRLQRLVGAIRFIIRTAGHYRYMLLLSISSIKSSPVRSTLYGVIMNVAVETLLILPLLA